jgi:hypothetical protein
MGLRTPTALLLVSLSLTAACVPGTGGRSSLGQSGGTASCAVVIEVAGVTYIAGRGASSVPETGAALSGKTMPCDDGGRPVAGHPLTAHPVPRVRTTDAVAADGYQLLLAERLWKVRRAQLPSELQPYISR